MITSGLLADLHRRRFALAVVDDQLRVTPASHLTDADRDAIRARKAELIGLLRTFPACPGCSGPGRRLGSFVLADGRGRYTCDACKCVWWGPVYDPNDQGAARTWDEQPPWNGRVSDAQYDAVKRADIERFGYYTPSRRYPEPAEPPESIWKRYGLTDATNASRALVG